MTKDKSLEGVLPICKFFPLKIKHGLGFCYKVTSGPAKSDFDLLFRFLLEVFFTCPYDIYIVNS